MDGERAAEVPVALPAGGRSLTGVESAESGRRWGEGRTRRKSWTVRGAAAVAASLSLVSPSGVADETAARARASLRRSLSRGFRAEPRVLDGLMISRGSRHSRQASSSRPLLDEHSTQSQSILLPPTPHPPRLRQLGNFVAMHEIRARSFGPRVGLRQNANQDPRPLRWGCTMANGLLRVLDTFNKAPAHASLGEHVLVAR